MVWYSMHPITGQASNFFLLLTAMVLLETRVYVLVPDRAGWYWTISAASLDSD